MAIFRRCASVLAAAIILAPAAASAQQLRTLEVPANKKWQHAATGLIVPQSLAGLPRGEISDSTRDELDVMVQFGDPHTTRLTLYVFRPALFSVPLWFDRAETQILANKVFAMPTPRGEPVAFAPPRGATASALRRVYVPGARPYAASGVAILPLGDWLIAIRLSSTSLDPAALDAKLLEAVAGLGWPAPAAGAVEPPLAAPIVPCADSLAYSKKARLKKPDMNMALFGAVIASVGQTHASDTGAPATVSFCREGTARTEFAPYRGMNGSKGYVVAMGDAGRSVSVFPALALDAKPSGYAVTFSDLAVTYVFPSFDQLPTPEKAVEMIRKTAPISSSARGDKTLSVNIR